MQKEAQRPVMSPFCNEPLATTSGEMSNGVSEWRRMMMCCQSDEATSQCAVIFFVVIWLSRLELICCNVAFVKLLNLTKFYLRAKK